MQAAQQAQLRTALKQLQDEKAKINEELEALRTTLNKTKDQLENDRKEALATTENLDKSISELTDEKKAAEKKAAELEASLEEINERRKTAKSIEIQTESEARVRVQAFIEALEKQNSSGGTSSGVISDYLDTELSEAEEVVMHSGTLYKRPGINRQGKDNPTGFSAGKRPQKTSGYGSQRRACNPR